MICPVWPFAVEIEPHDLPGVAVCQPDGLVVGHEQPARGAGVLRLADVIAVSVDHLDAGVVAVGDVKQALGVEHQRMRQVELAGAFALLAENFQEIAVLVELQHQRVGLAVALQHEQIAGRTDHRLVGLVEQPQVPELMPLAGPAADAEHHLQPPGRVELVDHVAGDIRRPDVVLRVDAQPMGPVEQPVAEAADEVTVGVELHQRHRAAMQHEDVALGAEGNAGGAAEIRPGRQLEGFGNGRVVERWWCHLRPARSCDEQACQQQNQRSHASPRPGLGCAGGEHTRFRDRWHRLASPVDPLDSAVAGLIDRTICFKKMRGG